MKFCRNFAGIWMQRFWWERYRTCCVCLEIYTCLCVKLDPGHPSLEHKAEVLRAYVVMNSIHRMMNFSHSLDTAFRPQALDSSFSAVTKPILTIKSSLESAWWDLQILDSSRGLSLQVFAILQFFEHVRRNVDDDAARDDDEKLNIWF